MLKDMLAGRQVEIHTERDRKAEAAHNVRVTASKLREEQSGQPP